VTFLVRPARKARLDAEGLVIESNVGALRRPITTVTSETLPGAGAFDVVLLTCKAYDLEAAIDAVRPAVSPQTVVLPILNGLRHIDRLVEAFGPARVVGGLCKIQATLGPTGHVLHMNTWNEIVFGELAGGASERMTRLAAAFPKPQTNARASADIRTELWKKLVHLGTVAAITTLTRQSLDVVNRTADGRWLIEDTLRKAAAIATADGIPISEAAIDAQLKLFLTAVGPYKASMLRDMERGAPTEGEHILGDLRDRAAHHGIDAPIFRIAAANTAAYELARAAA
jgi:2-dehydropantoate 2-reductase